MFAEDQTAWECDMAETYGVFDYESIPVRKLATLSAGLREDSRSKMKIAGAKLNVKETLLAVIADRLTWLCWAKTEDGLKGRNAPPSILELLTGKKDRDSDLMAFDTGKEFEEERNRILSMMKGE